MPEGLTSGPKILGMPRKVAIPVLGVAVIAVVYVVIRGRSQGGSVPRMGTEDGGNTGVIGGGGGGGYIGGVEQTAPVNPIQEALDRLFFEREQFGYNIEQRKEGERQKEFEIAYEEKRSTLDKFLELLPFQLETQKSFEEAQQAGYQTERARAGYFEEAFETARAGEEVVQRSIAGKKKVECPVGMHFVVTADGGGACQPLGGGGFNLKTIFSGIGNIAEGIFKGAANAAPGVGAGALQGLAGQYIPGLGQKKPKAPLATPGINPEPFDATPYRFSGSTELSYPGLG